MITNVFNEIMNSDKWNEEPFNEFYPERSGDENEDFLIFFTSKNNPKFFFRFSYDEKKERFLLKLKRKIIVSELLEDHVFADSVVKNVFEEMKELISKRQLYDKSVKEAQSKLIKTGLDIDININELWVSPPGNGKTQRVLDTYPNAVVLLTSSMTEDAVDGIPYIKEGQEYRAMPPFMKRLWELHDNGEQPVLFLDELDKARQSVADTLLSLVCGGYCSAGEIPKNTKIIAAVNPEEWGGSDGLSDPMINRFMILDKTISKTSWIRYMLSKYPDFSSLIDLLNEQLTTVNNQSEYYLSPSTTPRSLETAFLLLVQGESSGQMYKGLLNSRESIVFTNIAKDLSIVNSMSASIVNKS